MSHELEEREKIAALARAIHADRIERARRMQPEDKLRAGAELFDLASQVTLAGIRYQHPEASEEEVRKIFRQRMEWAQLFGQPTFVPTAEDVVIAKLRWAEQLDRSKDIDDIRSVIHLQQQKLDWSYLESWCDRHGTRNLLDSLRLSGPPTS